MSILGLNTVELVSQSQVVFVSLLNFEDFCFKLRDKQVFLVTSQMDAVVILHSIKLGSLTLDIMENAALLL